MKKIGLLLIGLSIVVFANGQIIKIQGGTSISKLNWELKGLPDELAPVFAFEKPLVGYSIFVGVDYLDKKYFNLSSNIGMIRKGGKHEIKIVEWENIMDDPVLDKTETIINKATLDYLSINTTIDFKYPIKETIFPFVSIGPRLDWLLMSNKYFDDLEEMDALKKSSIGLILGGGLKYDISKFQFGLRADYYLDFKKRIADWTIENTERGGEVSVNTFTINLTVGYKLK